MLTAELDLQGGLWLMLLTQERASGWPVCELMTACSSLASDKQLATYLAPGAESNFRRFLQKRPTYFHYDAEEDTVALAEDLPRAVDQWLIRYLALQIQASAGRLQIQNETCAKCQPALPECMAHHLRVVYGNNLELFFKTHPRCFTVDESGTCARLTLTFHEESIEAFAKEENLVLFFRDLLQKIGATEHKPCHVHTVAKYVPFIKSDERKVLDESYRGNLSVFFLLNKDNFDTTTVEKGFVCLKNHDPHYDQALFLKQLVHVQSARTSGYPRKVSLEELATRARYSSSPVARCFHGVSSVQEKLRNVARRHPTIFHIDEQGKELWLTEECPPWPEDQWNAEAELLAMVYFIHVLRHIDATTPSRAVCFNYIVRAASAAPPNCKDCLECAYPALEVIGLFHLYPGIFDLSSVNRVCLSTEAAPENSETESDHDSVEDQAVEYVAKLLKYARDLNPQLLTICVETAPLGIRSYCMSPVGGRLQALIESGSAVLSAREADLLNCSSTDR